MSAGGAPRRPPPGPDRPLPARVASEIVDVLRSLGDPARAAGVQRFFKEPIAALGIDTPTLRRVAAAQVRRLRPLWGPADAVDCTEHLLGGRELEVRGAGLLLLGGFQAGLTAAFLSRAETWLRSRLDNWALVDSFCALVLSPLLAREPSMETTLQAWSGAENLWVRRAALVTLVPEARRGRRLALVYSLAGDHWGDPEDLIHKATGWLLREAGRTDAGRLREFLLQHGSVIPRTALRYAIERFSPDERRRLLQATRAGTASESRVARRSGRRPTEPGGRNRAGSADLC